MYSVASGSRKGQNSIPDQAMTKHDLRSKNIQLYLYPPFEIWLISYISIHVFSTIGYITNSEWFALQLAWLAQCIALRLDIAKVRIRFPIKPEFFQVLFQPPRLVMVLWRSCSLSFLYLQFKIKLISYYKRNVWTQRQQVSTQKKKCNACLQRKTETVTSGNDLF